MKLDIKILRDKYFWFGITILLLLHVIPHMNNLNEPYKTICSSIGVATFLLFTISPILSNELKNIIYKDIPLLEKCHKLGIVNLTNEDRFKELGIDDIYSSKELIIVMNDARSFKSGANADELNKRYKTKYSTTFILLDPDSDAEQSLCKANGKKEDGIYKLKINITIDEIKKDRENYSEHKFKIYKYPLGYFRRSIILTDSYAAVCFYRNAPGKEGIPLYVVYSSEQDSYKKIKSDINDLIKNSNEVT